MSTSCDKEALRQAYESVRDDKSDVNWYKLKSYLCSDYKNHIQEQNIYLIKGYIQI